MTKVAPLLMSLSLVLLLPACSTLPMAHPPVADTSGLAGATPAAVAAVHVQRGQALLAQRQGLQAQAEFRAALAAQPGDLAAGRALATLLGQGGQLAAAQEVLEGLLAQHPGDAALLNNLGYAHYLQGHAGRAVELLRDAAQRDPADLRTRNNLQLAEAAWRHDRDLANGRAEPLPAAPTTLVLDDVAAGAMAISDEASSTGAGVPAHDGAQRAVAGGGAEPPAAPPSHRARTATALVAARVRNHPRPPKLALLGSPAASRRPGASAAHPAVARGKPAAPASLTLAASTQFPRHPKAVAGPVAAQSAVPLPLQPAAPLLPLFQRQWLTGGVDWRQILPSANAALAAPVKAGVGRGGHPG